MKLAIVTDAWHPQTNGVVVTLTRTRDELEKLGHAVSVIGPDAFRTFPCPSYPEIRLALFARRKLHAMLDGLGPNAVHIATEGPLGLAARAWCRKRGFPFTTSFHTQFPEYIQLRTRIPVALTYRWMRWFHAPAATVMVATPSLRRCLEDRGFQRLGLWSRGVDTEVFRPRDQRLLDVPRPVFMYVGRVAVEKNLEAFLRLDLAGSKFVVGTGPDLDRLKHQYPEVHFTGHQQREDVAKHLAAADVFVFPSRTDTFGLVLLEALACGIPVAAYPVQGPIDIIENGVTGYLDEDLGAAALQALTLTAANCRRAAQRYTWTACTRQFLSQLQIFSTAAETRAAAN